jgi:hypothetical protein
VTPSRTNAARKPSGDRRGGSAVRRARRLGGARGSVTAETAVVLPVLLVVSVMLLWMLSVAAAQLRCIDASRVAARGLARGDEPAAVRAVAAQAAPDGARIELVVAGDTVTATVSARVRPPGGLAGGLASVDVSSSATGLRESAGEP